MRFLQDPSIPEVYHIVRRYDVLLLLHNSKGRLSLFTFSIQNVFLDTHRLTIRCIQVLFV